MPNPRLLLADDSIAIRKVVELTFADEGIDVYAVPDAQTAMQKFVEVQPDIVLVDVGLDGTSGYQICEMIKQDDQTMHIPVLLLVGSFEPFDKEAADRAGADGFLTKPFQSIRDLVNRVSELLGRGRPEQEAQPSVSEEPAEIAAAASSNDSMFNAPTIPSIDTADIEHLYERSFTETAEIEEFDTVEDVFDDDGLDDELIETTHPLTSGAPDQEGQGGDLASAQPDHNALEEAVTVKEFDWSPAAKVEESEGPTVVDVQRTTDAVAPAAPDTIGGMRTTDDPQTPTEADPDDDGEPGTVPSPTQHEHSEYVRILDDEPVLNSETVGEYQPNDLSTGVSSETDSQSSTVTFRDDSGEGTAQTADAFAEPVSDAGSEVELPEGNGHVYPAVSDPEENPSPELIDAIAQRVIERISDRVVREVAQEAVPRIAEKLIREALEDERKR